MKRAVATGMIAGFLSAGAAFAAGEEATGEPAASGNKNVGFNISLGTELMGGDTTYSIGAPVTNPDGSAKIESLQHFPFSQLEWPLDIWLARLDGTVNVGSSWRINGTLKKNISDPDDHMIDSDWIQSPSSLDVYSESNITDFDALIWDLDVEWVFFDQASWNIYAGLGYLYQNFEYEGAMIHQYSPSGMPGFEGYGDGSVSITYDMTYQMPYFLIGTDFHITPELTVSGSFSYSPWVNAEDEDNHLMRGKLNIGDMDGDAYIVDISGVYDFAQSWFMEAGFHYMKIDVDGEQRQSFYGVPSSTVHQESESTQTSGYFKVGYRF